MLGRLRLLTRGMICLTLLLLPGPVWAYIGVIEQQTESIDEKTLWLVYTFEWEVVDSKNLLSTHLDKAQIQARVALSLRLRIEEQIGRMFHAEALKLFAGERYQQLRATALRANGHIKWLGVHVIDIDFKTN